MSIVIDALKWRYATKKMNGSPVDQQTIDQIIEAARLAPSAFGLQPVKVIDISNPELKKKILPVANNQQQVVDCSHLLVFTAWDKCTPERIEERVQQMVEERNISANLLEDQKNYMLHLFCESATPEQSFVFTAKQAYIAFSMAIIAAAELRVDATPMSGFDSAALDELLELKKYGLKSVTILPVGHRDEQNDWLVSMKKVRDSKKDFVIELK